MSLQFARRVSLNVSINGQEVASYLAPYLLDFSYTDNSHGKADEIQLSLHNREGQFSVQGMPEKGMPLSASIICHDWEDQGQKLQLPCGTFKIDEVEISGPPDKIQIKAVSSELTGPLRDTQKTRAWENVSLSQIASQIASENGLELMYLPGEDNSGPQGSGPAAQAEQAGNRVSGAVTTSAAQGSAAEWYQRKDQRNESDLSFLNSLASENGLNLKAHDGKLILFAAEVAENASPGITIPKMGSMYSPKSYSFKVSSSKTKYTKAEAAYTDPKTGTCHIASATAASPEAAPPAAKPQPVSPQPAEAQKTLTLQQRAENPAQASRLAKSALNKANANELGASLECMGNPGLCAGTTLELSGFGNFSGLWYIKKATHKVSGNGGYSTSLELTGPTKAIESQAHDQVNEAARQAKAQKIAPKGDVSAQEALNILAREVAERGSDIDKLILCLPDIAAALAENCILPDDRTGWQHLAKLIKKWLGIKKGQKTVDPYWVDWDWLLSYRRARQIYNDFVNTHDPFYTLNSKGLESLCAQLSKAGFFDAGEGQFDFIAPPADSELTDWRYWEEYYFSQKTVPGFALWPDGLLASLGAFSFRALASGFYEKQNDGSFNIHIDKLAVYARDVFNFEGEQSLGYWSCAEKDFLPEDFYDPYGVAPKYQELSNMVFREFAKNYQAGGDFLVLSRPHLVEDFRGMDYVCK